MLNSNLSYCKLRIGVRSLCFEIFKEQQIVSEDEKHSFRVTKIFYKKKQLRLVAIEGRKCMDKMTGKARSEPGHSLVEMLNVIAAIDRQFDESVLHKSRCVYGRRGGPLFRNQ